MIGLGVLKRAGGLAPGFPRWRYRSGGSAVIGGPGQ